VLPRWCSPTAGLLQDPEVSETATREVLFSASFVSNLTDLTSHWRFVVRRGYKSRGGVGESPGVEVTPLGCTTTRDTAQMVLEMRKEGLLLRVISLSTIDKADTAHGNCIGPCASRKLQLVTTDNKKRRVVPWLWEMACCGVRALFVSSPWCHSARRNALWRDRGRNVSEESRPWSQHLCGSTANGSAFRWSYQVPWSVLRTQRLAPVLRHRCCVG
jgi:hypothetical protein